MSENEEGYAAEQVATLSSIIAGQPVRTLSLFSFDLDALSVGWGMTNGTTGPNGKMSAVPVVSVVSQPTFGILLCLNMSF